MDNSQGPVFIEDWTPQQLDLIKKKKKSKQTKQENKQTNQNKPQHQNLLNK